MGFVNLKLRAIECIVYKCVLCETLVSKSVKFALLRFFYVSF